jgi:hypothetical protein
MIEAEAQPWASNGSEPEPEPEPAPPSAHRLTIPRLAVVMDDGREFEVQALNPDLIRWDRTAAKHRWPSASVAPFLWMTFLAWSAARREQEIPAALTFEEFSEERCVQVRNLTDTEEGSADAADPTLRAPDPE